MRDILPINKKRMPYGYTIALGDQVFRINFMYNSRRNLFSVNLYKNGELLCAGEKLVYGRPLFEDVYTVQDFPGIRLVPVDAGGQENTISWENLGKTVFVTIDDVGEQP